MRIKNSTRWDSADLRKIFLRCVQEVQKSEKPKNTFRRISQHYTLKFANSSRVNFSGRAVLGDTKWYPRWTGLWMLIKIPNVSSADGIPFWNLKQKENLARTIIHELFHNLGTKFQDRHNYKNDWSKDWNVDWVKDYEIREKRVINSPKIDLKLVRYQRALKNFRIAETRFKRAKTILDKWQGTIKRYQKVYNYK